MSSWIGYSPLTDETIQNIINGTESFADQGFPSTAAAHTHSAQLINRLYKKIKSGDLTEAEALDKYKKEIEQLREKNQDPVAGWVSTIEALKEADGVLPSASVDANTETSFTRISPDDSYPEATGDLRAAFISTLPRYCMSNGMVATVGIQDNATGEKFKVTYSY